MASKRSARSVKSRVLSVLESESPLEKLLASCFKQQAEFVSSTSRRIAVRCSRRAGKSIGAVAKTAYVAYAKSNSLVAYITLTRRSAKNIVWKLFKRHLREWGIAAKFNESELTIDLPNGSTIRLEGADSDKLLGRLEGVAYDLVVIDEAEHFSASNLDRLVNDSIGPTLWDRQGVLVLMGRPGIIPRGLYYDATRTEEELRDASFDLISWSTEDNPHIAKQFRAEVEALSQRNPHYHLSPEFQRNFLGRWVNDTEHNVYRFDYNVNNIDSLSYNTQGCQHVRFICGMDLGWKDETAFVVCAYSPQTPNLTVVDSFKQSKMLGSDIAAQYHAYCERFPGIDFVCDPSSAQFLEELRSRYGLHILPAKKSAKEDRIQLINTDLVMGRINILNAETSVLAGEMIGLKWLYNDKLGSRKEHPQLPNHACDAFSYAYLHCRHYWYEEEKPKLAPTSREAFDAWAKADFQRAVEESLQPSNVPWWQGFYN